MVLPPPIPGRLGIVPGVDHWFPSFPVLSTLRIIPHWSLPALPAQEHRLTELQCPLGQPGLDARIGARVGDGGRDTDGQHEQEAEPHSTSRLVLGPGGWSRGHVWATRSWCRDPFPVHQHRQDLYRGQGALGDISTHRDTTVLWPPKAQPCPTHDSKGKPDPRCSALAPIVGAGECRVPQHCLPAPHPGVHMSQRHQLGLPTGAQGQPVGTHRDPAGARSQRASAVPCLGAMEEWGTR